MIKELSKYEQNEEIANLIHRYFQEFIKKGSKGPHATGRLILIQKKPNQIPNENNLRPIVVGSVMIKTLENIMLKSAKEKFLK